tara:strand:- start:104 stop:517 length:414 start_codon:yes stop_codon:yes gene_type:complete
MALAGAGNVSGGANPSGTGSSINYIGDHVYAYSGVISVTNAATTMLQFNTASEGYILADIQMFCGDSETNDFDFALKINGETISNLQLDNTPQQYAYGNYPLQVILAPDSRVEIIMSNQSSSTGREWTISLTGRVYA